MVISDGCKVEANLKVGDPGGWIPLVYISTSYIKMSTLLSLYSRPLGVGGL